MKDYYDFDIDEADLYEMDINEVGKENVYISDDNICVPYGYSLIPDSEELLLEEPFTPLLDQTKKLEKKNLKSKKKRITHCWKCKLKWLDSHVNQQHDVSKCSWRDDCIVCPQCGYAGCEKPLFSEEKSKR